MGWPSTENEFSAWSPRPWKRPFESADIPGVARVTNELTDEDWLSKGNLSNKFLSTSVWNVGSFSIKSPALGSPVTCVVELATCNLTVTLTGTDERGSTSCTAGPKPAAVTVMW